MLVLASQSQTRRALLESAGLDFRIEPAGLDERMREEQSGLAHVDLARDLAAAKAEIVSRRHPDDIVIGADQLLSFKGDILHKPNDLEDARARLDTLRGSIHMLLSGVALARAGKTIWTTVETASLTMRNFTENERDAVLTLEGDNIITSVGAYRLEGPSIRLFEHIEGDYFAILGLPLLPLLEALRVHAPETLELTT